MGYVYLVTREIRPDNLNDDFLAGDELVFRGPANFSKRNNLAGFYFTQFGNPDPYLKKRWVIEKENIDQWSHYFEEIRPAASHAR